MNRFLVYENMSEEVKLEYPELGERLLADTMERLKFISKPESIQYVIKALEHSKTPNVI